MKISDLTELELQQSLKQGTLNLHIEPFVIRLKSSIQSLSESLVLLYSDFPVTSQEQECFTDFYIELRTPSSLRRFYRPQVNFYLDSKSPFIPLPLSQAFPFFEWGLNWCIASHFCQHLLIHAAVVEKHGFALILPGQPGAGKSTLCAALVLKGWRLLSDEMAVIDLAEQTLIPIVRPVSLKNESIELIKKFSPSAVIGNLSLDTKKGTVTHMKPPLQSVVSSTIRAKARYLVFPRFLADSQIKTKPIDKGATIIKLAENSFNYNVLGLQGFNALCEIVNQSACFELTYSKLDDAIGFFEKIVKKNSESLS